jgi:hypothetical protein
MVSGSRGMRQQGTSRITTIQRTINVLLSVPAAGTATVFPVYSENSTLFGSALSAIASVYAMYRFRKIEVEMLPPSGTGTVVLAYQPLSTFTSVSPGNYDDVSQMELTQMTSPSLTVPRHLSVNGYELVTEKEFRWFRSSAVGTGALNPQGCFCLAQRTGSAGFLDVRVTFLVDFCAANDVGIQSVRPSLSLESKIVVSPEEVTPRTDRSSKDSPRHVGSRLNMRDKFIYVRDDHNDIIPPGGVNRPNR